MLKMPKSEAKIPAAESEGWTPLLAAAFSGHSEAVSLLLAAGADMNMATKDGEELGRF